MVRNRKRKVIYLDDLNGLNADFKRGKDTLKSKETLKKVGLLAVGSLSGKIAVALSNKLTSNTTQVFQYGAGSLSSGIVTMLALGTGYSDIGYGSAMITADQLINTASTLLTGKNLSQNLNNK